MPRTFVWTHECAPLTAHNVSQVQPGIYLLDLQKIKGDAFSFMNLCAQIILELKVPRAGLTVARLAATISPGSTRPGGHLHASTSATSLPTPRTLAASAPAVGVQPPMPPGR